MMLTILKAAKAANACAGQYNAALKYCKAGDVEGFERVCRGSHKWLAGHGIAYALTDGTAEVWHSDGTLGMRCTHEQGKRHGPYEEWHSDGTLGMRCTYERGKLHGLWEWWHSDGTLGMRCTYERGKLHGPYEEWHSDGTLGMR